MSHNRKVLVFKAVNYGASKASATAETALNPTDLADGAVGIYGIHEAGATNLNKLVLLTDGGSEVAGKVPVASFVGKEVFVAQGTVTDVRLSNPIRTTPVRGIIRSGGSAYVAPVREINNIGWNGVAGSALNLPSTINRGDDFIVSLMNRNYAIAGFQEPGQKVILSAQTAAGDTQYQILSKWVAAVNRRIDDILINKTSIRITNNGTGTPFTTSATVTAVNGATTLATSAAHGVTAGQGIVLGGATGAAGDYYLAQAGTTGSTLVLDRPYQGPSGTIANANTINVGSSPTQWGLAFADARDFLNVTCAVQGIAQNATVRVQVAPTTGSGSNAEVVALEKDALSKKGTEDQITAYIPKDIIYSQVAGANQNYDLYYFEIGNVNHPGGDTGSVYRVLNYLTCAFPSGIADTAGFNQASFENVMQSLFTTALVPSIS